MKGIIDWFKDLFTPANKKQYYLYRDLSNGREWLASVRNGDPQFTSNKDQAHEVSYSSMLGLVRQFHLNKVSKK